MEEVESKNSVLDDLYALRAGLSVISEGRDQINQSGKKADEIYHEYFCDFYKNNGYTNYGILDLYSDKVQEKIDANRPHLENGLWHSENPARREVWKRQQEEGMVALWDGADIPKNVLRKLIVFTNTQTPTDGLRIGRI